MLEKIKIENYGPFKEAEVNFVNNSEPIYIIGMNEVGKTTLLSSINSLSKGLSDKYFINNKSKIEISLHIKKDFYEDRFVKEFEKIFEFGVYEGKILIKRGKGSKKTIKKIDFFSNNFDIKEFTKKIIKKINDMLPRNSKKINFNNIENSELKNFLSHHLLFDYEKNEYLKKINFKYNRIRRIDSKYIDIEELQKLDSLLNETNIKENQYVKSQKMIQLFLDFKNQIYRISTEKVRYLKANENDPFKYIKDEYLLFDDEETNENDLDKLKKIIESFLLKKKFFEFKEIINSDENEKNKNRKLVSFGNKISQKMNDFFKDYFPSQNENLDFNMNLNGNFLYWTVKDDNHDFDDISKRSDGFKWFINLFIFISSIEPYDLILIDEPEKFLHPSAQIKLVELFNKKKIDNKIQIIYATHSPFMLSKRVFSNVKIIDKKIDGSIIYNNVNAFMNKNDKTKNVLLPIASSFGIPMNYFFCIDQFDKNKKILFVEGEADISIIKISELIAKKKIKNIIIWPMLGNNCLHSIEMAIAFELDFLVFLDGKKQKGKWPEDKTFFLFDLIKFEEPENLLNEKTLKKYDMKNKNNHKIAWKSLLDDIKLKEHNLDNFEKEKFKKYNEKLLNKLSTINE